MRLKHFLKIYFTHFFTKFTYLRFPVYEIMWKNVVEPDRDWPQRHYNTAHAICMFNT